MVLNVKPALRELVGSVGLVSMDAVGLVRSMVTDGVGLAASGPAFAAVSVTE